MTSDCVQDDTLAHEPELLSRLVRPTGFIPGTDCTPDIFYADEAGAARVALTSFLLISHLDRTLQAYIKAHLDRIICSFSPQSGGRSMEACLVKGRTYPITQRLPAKVYSRESADKKTIGRFFPEFQSIAVYAVSDEYDDSKGLAKSRQAEAHARQKHHLGSIGLNEKFHLFASDTGETEAVLHELYDILGLPDTQDLLLDMLCLIAESRTSGKVPLTLAHEIAHFIEPLILEALGSRSDSACYPSSMLAEIKENIPSGDDDFGYFRKPREALAELVGCAILERIREKTGCNIMFQTDGLETVLPKSYKLAKYALSQIARDAEPVQHYQPSLAR